MSTIDSINITDSPTTDIGTFIDAFRPFSPPTKLTVKQQRYQQSRLKGVSFNSALINDKKTTDETSINNRTSITCDDTSNRRTTLNNNG